MNGEDDLEPDSPQLLERISDALTALSGVELGDYTTRIRVDDTTDEVLASLFVGINDMIEVLDQERRRNEAYQAERQQKLRTIAMQKEALRELSTPILDVWNGIVCVPVVGTIDTARSAEMTADLLQAIVARKARGAIIDVTGIDIMDTSTAQHFVHMAKSARLLGAECAITGINPGIADTIVHMGMDLQGVVTYRSLRDALRHFVVAEERRLHRRRQALIARRQLDGVPGSEA